MCENNLKDKKILFISPVFNKYPQYIKNSFEKLGYEVELYYETSNNFFIKKMSNISKFLQIKIQSKYQNHILNNLKSERYDFLFVIKAEYLSGCFFQKLFNRVNIKNKICYQWDSVDNNPNMLNIINYFDKTYTFDSQDAEKYDFVYKPLFYIDLFSPKKNKKEKYDLFFIGIFHSNRAVELNKIIEFAKKNNISYKIKLYMPILQFVKHRIFDKTFKLFTKDIIFKGISLSQVADLLHESKCVIDIAHEKQNGLTIRTFETLGANKKLITNNKNVLTEDFYSKENILILDNISNDFIRNKFDNISNCKIKKYHIDNWVKEFV